MIHQTFEGYLIVRLIESIYFMHNMFCPHNIDSFDPKVKHLNVIILRHIGRYKVTTYIYMHFVQVANDNVFTSNLFTLQRYQNFILNISNCTQTQTQFGPLNTGVFSFLSISSI